MITEAGGGGETRLIRFSRTYSQLEFYPFFGIGDIFLKGFDFYVMFTI